MFSILILNSSHFKGWGWGEMCRVPKTKKYLLFLFLKGVQVGPIRADALKDPRKKERQRCSKHQKEAVPAAHLPILVPINYVKSEWAASNACCRVHCPFRRTNRISLEWPRDSWCFVPSPAVFAFLFLTHALEKATPEFWRKFNLQTFNSTCLKKQYNTMRISIGFDKFRYGEVCYVIFAEGEIQATMILWKEAQGHLHKISYHDGRILIQEVGLYVVYVKTCFRYYEELTKPEFLQDGNTQLIQYVYHEKHTQSTIKPMVIMKSGSTKRWKNGVYNMYCEQQSGIFTLKEGDGLFVNVSNSWLLDPDPEGSYFGAFKISNWTHASCYWKTYEHFDQEPLKTYLQVFELLYVSRTILRMCRISKFNNILIVQFSATLPIQSKTKKK